MAEKYPATSIVPSEGSGQAGKIRCAHLLVKHKDSRRPSSWKEVCLDFFSPFFDERFVGLIFNALRWRGTARPTSLEQRRTPWRLSKASNLVLEMVPLLWLISPWPSLIAAVQGSAATCLFPSSIPSSTIRRTNPC